MNGKGSDRRPAAVSQDEIRRRWEKTFGRGVPVSTVPTGRGLPSAATIKRGLVSLPGTDRAITVEK